jgi:hypothetical protein
VLERVEVEIGVEFAVHDRKDVTVESGVTPALSS